MYWFVKSDSCCCKFASTSNFFARFVAILATFVAVLASSFNDLAFDNSSFFFVTSVIEFAFVRTASASFCKAMASAVFCVANPKASSASFFN